MHRLVALIAVSLLLCPTCANADEPDAALAVALERLGCNVWHEQGQKGKPIVSVVVPAGAKFAAEHVELLSDLKHVHTLQLYGPAFTDKGLAQLEKLTMLHTLT